MRSGLVDRRGLAIRLTRTAVELMMTSPCISCPEYQDFELQRTEIERLHSCLADSYREVKRLQDENAWLIERLEISTRATAAIMEACEIDPSADMDEQATRLWRRLRAAR